MSGASVLAVVCPPWCTSGPHEVADPATLGKDPVAHLAPDFGEILVHSWDDGTAAARHEISVSTAEHFERHVTGDPTECVKALRKLANDALQAASWLESNQR